ncbi:MAG: toll/interleukin-1 receptor domain-containing protein, partial [Nitrosopumilaceae archaeon]
MQSLEKGQGCFEVFFSYSHKDEEYRNELEKHLSGLIKEGTIECWHDRKIGPGDDWMHVISDHLKKANMILFLVSSDFIHSTYCYDVEVAESMRRHENGESHVIPVILRPCDWKNLPFFSKLQPLPKDGIPVKSWSDRDEAFLNIVEGIRSKLNELRKPKNPTPDLAPSSSQPNTNNDGSTSSKDIEKVQFVVEINVKIDMSGK